MTGHREVSTTSKELCVCIVRLISLCGWFVYKLALEQCRAILFIRGERSKPKENQNTQEVETEGYQNKKGVETKKWYFNNLSNQMFIDGKAFFLSQMKWRSVFFHHIETMYRRPYDLRKNYYCLKLLFNLIYFLSKTYIPSAGRTIFMQ